MADETVVSEADVLSQLRTRGFETGFQRTPLRDFWGTLTKIGGVMRPGNKGPYLVVLYDFDELEVLVSSEPYDSPIGQIEISQSTKDKSKMGYWGASVDRVINAGVAPDITEGIKKQESMKGKRLHLKLTPGHLIANMDDNGAWSDKPTDCWELIEIAGEGAIAPPTTQTSTTATAVQPGPSASQEALKELDGKTLQDWHQVVFANPVVKADLGVLNSIISNTFLGPFEADGVVSKDKDDIYHVTLKT